jgi:hypothetical protein
MQRSVGLTVIVVLALMQGVLGILRAFKLFQIGIDLTGRGVLFLPLMGVVTFARGGLVVVIALLYILFAWGALTRRHWAWWVGLVASLVNGLVVVSTVTGGESVVQASPWVVVPVILICYLLTPAGRQALKS